jgi:hypothetical protein
MASPVLEIVEHIVACAGWTQEDDIAAFGEPSGQVNRLGERGGKFDFRVSYLIFCISLVEIASSLRSSQ